MPRLRSRAGTVETSAGTCVCLSGQAYCLYEEAHDQDHRIAQASRAQTKPIPRDACTSHAATDRARPGPVAQGFCAMTPLTSSDTRSVLAATKLRTVEDLVLQRRAIQASCKAVPMATTSQSNAHVSFEVSESQRVVIARTVLGSIHCWMVMSSQGNEIGPWALDTPASLLAEAVEVELDQLARD
jgi:hypothetical protein